MELRLEDLFDGPPQGSGCLGPLMDPGSQPLSFRHFSRDMLQVLHTHDAGSVARSLLAAC